MQSWPRLDLSLKSAGDSAGAGWSKKSSFTYLAVGSLIGLGVGARLSCNYLSLLHIVSHPPVDLPRLLHMMVSEFQSSKKGQVSMHKVLILCFCHICYCLTG